MNVIVNNELPWNGTLLGTYPESNLLNRWDTGKTPWASIHLTPNGKHNVQGTIYCGIVPYRNTFPLIIDEIRTIFDLPRRGLHVIVLGQTMYLISYISTTMNNELIWDTPLNMIGKDHTLRKDPELRKQVQYIILFCELLALTSTGEPKIILRPGVNNSLIPINTNDVSTTISRGKSYDYSVLTSPLINKWFGDNDLGSIIGELIAYDRENMNYGRRIAQLRKELELAINKYDSGYVWYVNFIIDRISRYISPKE